MLSKTLLAVKKWWFNLFSLEPTEKDAIHGHSVDRYAYAVKLLDEGSNESLIKAYAWLLVAAEEIDRKKPATLLLHKLQYELKKRGVFEKAQILGKEYMYLYSAEGAMRALRASKNPVDYLLRLVIYIGEFLFERIEYLDKKIFKKRGNLNTWMIIGAISWCSNLGILWYFLNNSGIFPAILLTLSMLSMMVSCSIWGNRSESESD